MSCHHAAPGGDQGLRGRSGSECTALLFVTIESPQGGLSGVRQISGKADNMEDTILKLLVKKMTGERFENIVSAEKEYKRRSEKIEMLSEQLRRQELTKEQRLAVDRLLTANNECNFRYSELAYIQGMKDAVAMLKELDLIKSVS